MQELLVSSSRETVSTEKLQLVLIVIMRKRKEGWNIKTSTKGQAAVVRPWNGDIEQDVDNLRKDLADLAKQLNPTPIEARGERMHIRT